MHNVGGGGRGEDPNDEELEEGAGHDREGVGELRQLGVEFEVHERPHRAQDLHPTALSLPDFCCTASGFGFRVSGVGLRGSGFGCVRGSGLRCEGDGAADRPG